MLFLLLAACRHPDTGKPGHNLDSAAPCTESAWYADADGDGHGTAATAQDACDQPAGWVASGDDCDDTLADVYPGALELCNAIDDDCDGTVDDNPADGTTWNVDADGDGYGAPMVACESPGVEVADTSDCDDTDADVYPGSTEIDGNGADDDCDGRVDEIRVCQDGTGDHDTIQAAVDAAPVEGAVVEICPGTYYEAVTIGDRVIEIVGETGDPEDVVIDASDLGRAIYAIAYDAQTAYTIRGLTLIGGPDGAITVFGGDRLSISHLVVRDTDATDIYMVMLYATAIEVEDCEMYDNSAPIAYFLLVDGNEDSYVRRCYLHGNDAAVLIYGPGTEISNNLIVANEAYYHLIKQADLGPKSASLLFNNTILDNIADFGPLIEVTIFEEWYTDRHNFRNNIFSGNVADDLVMYDLGGWGTCASCDHNGDGTCSASEALANCSAPILEYNWSGESLAGQCTSSWCASMLSGNQPAVDLDLSEASDPPYALPGGCPAIDGGDPSAEYMDGDGSFNDPGRYGGPNAYE